MRKHSFSKEEKLEILKLYHEGPLTLNEVEKVFNGHRDRLRVHLACKFREQRRYSLSI